MYKKQKTLKWFLNSKVYEDELFSRSSLNVIIRALLEPVVNQNAASIIFCRFKNTEGLNGLIKRLEYCTNVELIDVSTPGLLIKDDYIELEFIILTSARYNFALIWDYSQDVNKNYTKAFFLANSGAVNELFEILQANMRHDYRQKFYFHRPERRDNKLLNEALFNVFKKLNNSIEESVYKSPGDYVTDLSQENATEEKIRQISHEMKNQISVLDVYTGLLEKKIGANKDLDIIKKSLGILNMQLNELKDYDECQINEISLLDVIENSITIFGDILALNNNKILLKNNTNYDVQIFADENKLLSVFNNILKNANEASKNDEIIIELSALNNSIIIDFTNHGNLISDEVKKHLFEKGFTKKQNGTGIGLFSSKKIIEKFNGNICLLNSNKNFTTFRITLPLI